jgi:hypothetical protein
MKISKAEEQKICEFVNNFSFKNISIKQIEKLINDLNVTGAVKGVSFQKIKNVINSIDLRKMSFDHIDELIENAGLKGIRTEALYIASKCLFKKLFSQFIIFVILLCILALTMKTMKHVLTKHDIDEMKKRTVFLWYLVYISLFIAYVLAGLVVIITLFTFVRRQYMDINNLPVPSIMECIKMILTFLADMFKPKLDIIYYAFLIVFVINIFILIFCIESRLYDDIVARYAKAYTDEDFIKPSETSAFDSQYALNIIYLINKLNMVFLCLVPIFTLMVKYI